MQDIQALIEYFSASRPLIVVGSGPSCEIGLPAWKGLADSLLEKLRLDRSLDIEAAEEAFAREDFAAVFGNAIKSAGKDAVYEYCKLALSDTGRTGDLYSLLVGLPARGFITTNFDSILRRHFLAAGTAALEFLNTPEDLAAIDFETVRSILKIHGDFDHPEFLILTDKQYREIMHDGRFLTLREFIKAYLQTSRIVFIGYSLKDPDFSFLLEATAQTLRRKVPLFGIVANANANDIETWFERYNLRVVTYRSVRNDHSDLKNILETLASFFSASPTQDDTVPFKAAQSLYMWHKLSSTEGAGAAVDALRAILLGVLASTVEPVSSQDLTSEISRTTGRPISKELAGAVEKALTSLRGERMVGVDARFCYAVTDIGRGLENKYSLQFNNLRRLFETQVGLDLAKKLAGATDGAISKLVEKVHSCVLKIFSDRGGELVDASFSGRFEAPSSMNLVRIINSFSAGLDESQRYVFFSYLMSLMTRPREEQKPYLNYLAKAFFAAQVIGVDPEGQLFRREVLKARTLIIDANILIPLLAKGSVNQQYMEECIRTLSGADVKLVTIPKFCEEVSSHFQWGVDHVRRYGPQSMEVLSAALGSLEFRRNECIDGFIRVAAENDQSIDEYMETCFGGDPNFYNVRDACTRFNIEQVTLNDLASIHQELWVVQTDIEGYISALQVGNDAPKSEARIKAEADAYAICFGWNYAAEPGVDLALWKCSILSRGTSLNRVARFGPHPLDRPVVLRPDLLQEFISDFLGGEQTVSVSDVMLASYVRSIDYFIDKVKYSEFFKPLIKQAEAIYRDNLDRFQSLIDSSIDAAGLEQYEELEKPLVVNSLQQDVVAAVDTEMSRLASEVESLKHEKQKSEELAKLAMSYLSPTLRKRIERISAR
ncbi:MAG: SIR2 family protein [Terracidiphilus sp.]